MKRIIPWALPSVNGGSEGGYTPQPTPEPPTPAVYISIDDVKSWFNEDDHISCTMTNGTTTLTGLRYANFSGIEAVNLVGVSSASLVMKANPKGDTNETTITLSLDLLNLNAVTFVEGSTTNAIYKNFDEFVIDSYELFVFNSNGEILQNTKVEVGE